MEEAALRNSTVGTILLGIQVYYTPLLVILGTIGNCLSVLVFFTTKLRKLSSSYYLSALAVSDTGFLLCHFMTYLTMMGVNIFNREGFCQALVYLSQVFSFLSVWFIVAFTVERFIAVRYPLKRPSMCTVTRAKVVLLGLTLLALGISIPYGLGSAIVQGQNQTVGNETLVKEVCSAQEEWMPLLVALNYADNVLNLLAPFLLIAVLNTLISRTVWKVARVRRSMTKSTAAASSGTGASNARGASRTVSSQTKVTEMLLVVSTVFILLTLPSYIMRIVVYLAEDDGKTNLNMILLQHFTNVFYHTNFGLNFVLYCLSGQNFRRTLYNIFCPARARRRAENTQVTVVSEYTRSASTRRTVALNGSWREAHEMLPINRPNPNN